MSELNSCMNMDAASSSITPSERHVFESDLSALWSLPSLCDSPQSMAPTPLSDPSLQLSWELQPQLLLPSPKSTEKHCFPDDSSVSQNKPPGRPVNISQGSSHTRKMGPGHIKRPCNAFILFRSHAVAANLVPKEVERDHRNISRIISHMWHSLGKEERALWEAQAEAEKERHRREYPGYKYRPGSRRTNIHRRNVRRLSGTERQCEQIADVILKACGRAGVKRRRSSTTQGTPSSVQELATAPNVFVPARPTLRRSFSTDVAVLPPTNVNRQAVMDNKKEGQSFLAQSQLDNNFRVYSRRSSSAPPVGYNDLNEYVGEDASDHSSPMNQFADETLDWILNTPLLSEQPSPFQPFPSGVTPPFQKDDMLDSHQKPSLNSSAHEQKNSLGGKQSLQGFSMGPDPQHSQQASLLGLVNIPVAPYLPPPVSPKTFAPTTPCLVPQDVVDPIQTTPGGEQSTPGARQMAFSHPLYNTLAEVSSFDPVRMYSS